MLKKRFYLLTAVSLLSVGLLSGCGTEKKPSEESKESTPTSQESQDSQGSETELDFTVKYYVGTEQYGDTLTVKGGSKLTKPTDPTKADDEEYTYTFDGWYENGSSKAWNFESDTVTKNLELFAEFNRSEILYDLSVWVWGGTTTVYITEDEFDGLKTQVARLPSLNGKNVQYKYVNDLTNPAFNDAVMNGNAGVVVSGAKMDKDEVSVELDEEGVKVGVGFGWFASTNRYVGIKAGLNDATFALAKDVYDLLKADGPDYFEADIDTTTLVINETAHITTKNKAGEAFTDNMVYASSNEEVATVTQEGVITAMAEGEATVSVTHGFAVREFKMVVSAKQINLKVAIWAKNGSNIYATQEQIDAVEAGFVAYAATLEVEVNARFDYVSGNTEHYAEGIPVDTMVVLSGPKTMEQTGALTQYEVINATFERVRYAGIMPGYADNEIVALLVKYLCDATIVVTVDGVEGTQNITKLGGETVTLPEIQSTETKIHIGWAITSDATEALFGADAKINYGQLVDYAVDGAVTLYPVFSTKQINLKVAVWAVNGDSVYATEEEIAAVKEGFKTYAAGLEVEIVSRFDAVSGKKAEYAANIPTDTMVVLSGKNVIDQCGDAGMTILTDYVVINATFSSVRYFGIVDGFEDNEIVKMFATYLCDGEITVKIDGAEDQKITALGEEIVVFPEVSVPDGKELGGWAVTADAEEALFGAAAELKYSDLAPYAVEGVVSLYPFFQEKAAVENMLIVDIILGTNKNLFITEDDVDLIKTTFDAALAANEYDIAYEVRAEFRGTGEDFNKRVNAAGDVDVVIGASNLTSQPEWSGLYGETTWDNITIAITSNSRYVGILAGCAATHLVYAQLFCACLTTAA